MNVVGPDRTPSGRRRSIVAWTVAAITTVLALTAILLELLGPGPSATSADPDAGAGGVVLVSVHSIMASAFAVLGAVVVSRQPRNAVGWLMVLIGFFFMYIALSNEVYLQIVLNGHETSDLIPYVLWGGNWAWLFAMVPAVTFLPLLFPTGRSLTPRWRPVAWVAAIAVAMSFVGAAFKAGPLDGATAVENPMGVDSRAIELIGALGGFLIIAAFFGSVPSLIVRFRRSTGAERQQIKWVAYAALLLPIAATGLGVHENLGWPLILIAMLIVAIAVTVAMLRYRLYDIDVVVNRALVYGSLTAALAGVYVGSVLLLQVALSGLTEGSGLAVAASTLAVAALVRPARARIQQTVDRRFFRSRYDAARTVELFGARLRDEVDLSALSIDLQAVVSETMRPAHVSLWLRTAGGSR